MAYKDSYTVEGGKLSKPKSCPKCGTGVFLAEHKDRRTCGRCRYVEFKKKSSEEE